MSTDVEMKDDSEVLIDNAAFDEAVSIEDVSPTKAMQLYQQVVLDADASGDHVRVKEESVAKLAALYAKHGKTTELKQLLTTIQPFFATIPKSRTAKIVRQVIDLVIASPELAAEHAKQTSALKAAGKKGLDAGPPAIQVQICLDAIAWCQTEKRTFLKQRIQARLAALYVKLKQYTDALPLITKLIKEVKVRTITQRPCALDLHQLAENSRYLCARL